MLTAAHFFHRQVHIKEFSERRRKAPTAEALAAAEAEAEAAAADGSLPSSTAPRPRGEMNKDYISAAIMVEKESQVGAFGGGTVSAV